MSKCGWWRTSRKIKKKLRVFLMYESLFESSAGCAGFPQGAITSCHKPVISMKTPLKGVRSKFNASRVFTEFVFVF